MKNQPFIKLYIFSLLLLVVPTGVLSAQEGLALFTEAGKAYQEGDYETAIAKYQTILESQQESWEVYFNLGNALYKKGDVARAILNFERAKRLDPKNEDIGYNLEFARLATVDRIQKMPQFILSRWFSSFTHLFSIEVITWTSMAIYFSLIIVIISKLLMKSAHASRFVLTLIVVSSFLLVISSVVLLARIYENESKVEAIVLIDKIDIKSAPDESGTDVFILHAGVKVEVKDRSLNWVKIKLTDGKTGWLQKQAIEEI